MFVFLCFFFLLKPLFYSVFNKNAAKIKETQKTNKTLFVSTPVLTALVPVSFSLHFSSLGFFAISKYLRDVF